MFEVLHKSKLKIMIKETHINHKIFEEK
jgi:hypothetical protein